MAESQLAGEIKRTRNKAVSVPNFQTQIPLPIALGLNSVLRGPEVGFQQPELWVRNIG